MNTLVMTEYPDIANALWQMSGNHDRAVGR